MSPTQHNDAPDDPAAPSRDPVNPFLPQFRDDPYPAYHELRRRAPVYEIFPRLWVLTRYSDCAAVLRDHARFSSDPRAARAASRPRPLGSGPPVGGEAGSTVPLGRAAGRERSGPRVSRTSNLRRIRPEATLAKTILFIDPPEHDRIRAVVAPAFTFRKMKALRSATQALVDGMLDELDGAHAADLVSDLAYRVPLMVVCEILGVPPADRAQFAAWSSDLAPVLDPFMSMDVVDRAGRASAGLTEYFRGLLRDVDATGDGVPGALVRGRSEGRLTEDEVTATCVMLVGAGHETSVNMIANSLLALLRHPDEFDLLRSNDHPAFRRSAVEELLRFDAPVQMTSRTVTEDVEISGVAIPKGHEVAPVIGAANRDPAQFPDPDRLDLTRGDGRHLSFAAGAHFCLGAHLARMEGDIAVGSVVRRWPKLDLAGAPKRRETMTLRGLTSLPVTLR